MKSKSDKRLIVTCTLNGKPADFLLDTGATVGLINERAAKKYKCIWGREFGTLNGAGGEFDAYYCKTFAYLQGKAIPQFLIADIGNVVESIRKETGIEIAGIIGLPQMQLIGIDIDANDHEITIE